MKEFRTALIYQIHPSDVHFVIGKDSTLSRINVVLHVLARCYINLADNLCFDVYSFCLDYLDGPPI